VEQRGSKPLLLFFVPVHKVIFYLPFQGKKQKGSHNLAALFYSMWDVISNPYSG
jgi:hypothetical protein